VQLNYDKPWNRDTKPTDYECSTTYVELVNTISSCLWRAA